MLGTRYYRQAGARLSLGQKSSGQELNPSTHPTTISLMQTRGLEANTGAMDTSRKSLIRCAADRSRFNGLVTLVSGG